MAYDRNQDIEKTGDQITTYHLDWHKLIEKDGREKTVLAYQRIVHRARMLSMVVSDKLPDGEPVFKTMDLHIPEELFGVGTGGRVQRIITMLCKSLQIGWVSTQTQRGLGLMNIQIEYRDLSYEEKVFIGKKRVYASRS